MRIVPISEALGRVGESLTCITGNLTALYGRKEGAGQYGPWSLQNGEIQDNTGKIKVVFSGFPLIPESRKGMLVTITATQGKKALQGITVVENKWTDKAGVEHFGIECKVTASANVDWGTLPVEGNGPAPERPAPAQTQEQAPKSPAPSYALAYAPPKTSSVGKVVGRVNQLNNLYTICMDIAAEGSERQGRSGEDIRARCSSLFIQVSREGLQSEMPTTPLTNYFTPKPEEITKGKEDPFIQEDAPKDIDQEGSELSQPETWEECICHLPEHKGEKLGDMDLNIVHAMATSWKPKPVNGAYSQQDVWLFAALKQYKETLKKS